MKDDNLDVIEKARSGNSDAFECIFKQYLPIVLHQRNKSYLRDYELDDWLQEGRIVCLKSLQKYNSELNVTFGLFFKINFERWVVSAIRYQEAKKRKINQGLESLEQRVADKGDIPDPVTSDYQTNANLEYIFVKENLEKLSNTLSPFEVEIYYYVLRGKDLDVIAQHLRVDYKRVICGYSRLRRKLKIQLEMPFDDELDDESK